MFRKSNFERGVTLIEALVVIALIGVVLLILIPNFVQLLQSYRTQTTIAQMSTNLRFVRNAAVKQKVTYRVRMQRTSDSPSNRYILEYRPYGSYIGIPHFKTDSDGGSPCNCILMPDGIDILDTTTATSIEFDSRGSATGSGDVLVQGLDGYTYRIRISAVGGVETKRL